MKINSFDALEEHMSQRPPLRVAVAGADDSRVLAAMADAAERGQIAKAILVGDAAEIRRLMPDSLAKIAEIIDAQDADICATKAVAAIRQGDKGHVNSTPYLRAVVNKDT